MSNKKNMFFTICLLFTYSVEASEMVFNFNNPSFGGNSLNGTYFLNNANAQNDYKDPSSSSGYTPPSDLERLTSSLQSRLISQLLADVQNGQEGSFETDQFSLNITDDTSGGLEISIIDRTTGESTIINVNGLVAD